MFRISLCLKTSAVSGYLRIKQNGVVTHYQAHKQDLVTFCVKGGGLAANSSLFTPGEFFKSIMRPEICDIILQKTNQRRKRVCDAFNNNLMKRFPFASGRPPSKTFQPFTEAELLAFIGMLIAAGVHRQDKENLDDMWKGDALPLIRASMSRDRFQMMLRFIRFDNENTRAERAQTDKAAPIRDIGIMLNRNLEKAFKPYECITIDEQLFPFSSHTKSTQYIPSKPAKYGIKVSGLAIHQMHTHCKVRFTLEN